MGLRELVGAGAVAVDTAVFSYFAERNPDYADLVRPMFAAADRGALALVTSAVTLLVEKP